MPLVLCDVGPRDGLQNESEVLEPGVRAELVNRLAAAGLRRVEAVSFVRPDRVPQMAGAEEVVEGIERRNGTEYSGLVPPVSLRWSLPFGFIVKITGPELGLRPRTNATRPLRPGNAASAVASVGTTSARSSQSLRCSQLVSAINRQP